MTGQPTLFDAPPPVHRDATDQERRAAESLAPTAAQLRRRVFALALERGARGVTGWEAVTAFGLEDHETSVRPRLSELTSKKHGALLRKSRMGRANRHGNRDAAYVAVVHWRPELHAPMMSRNPARGETPGHSPEPKETPMRPE